MHLKGERDIAREATAQRAAFIAFDILRDGGEDLRPLILTDRRARLERLFGASGSSEVRHGEYAAGDGRRLYARAVEQGWEGLVAKRADSRYESDRRSPSWIKLKIKKTESLVVGGWTEPRETRKYFGALVLGAFTSGAPDAKLRYVGHVGSGFTDRELTRIAKMLRACATERTPFDGPVPANEAVHWMRAEAGRRGHVHRLDQRAAPAPRRVSGAARRRRPARHHAGRRRAVPDIEGDRDEPVGEARRADVARHAKGQGRQGRHQRQAGVDRGEARGRVGPGRHPHDAGARRPDRQAPGDGGREEGRRDHAARRRDARGHQPAQGVLAGRRLHQGRPAPLLRRACRRGCCRSSPSGRW